MAARAGVAPAALALRWVLATSAVSTAVVGVRTAAQLRTLLAVEEVDPVLLAELDRRTAQPARYPWTILGETGVAVDGRPG